METDLSKKPKNAFSEVPATKVDVLIGEVPVHIRNSHLLYFMHGNIYTYIYTPLLLVQDK